MMPGRSSVSVPPEVLRQVEEAVRSIRYGTVQVTIHNARVVQIETLEKVRIEPSADLVTGSEQTTAPTDRTSEGSRHASGR